MLTVNWANYCTVCHTWAGGGGERNEHRRVHACTHKAVVTITEQILIMNHLWPFTAAENNPRHLQATTNLNSYSFNIHVHVACFIAVMQPRALQCPGVSRPLQLLTGKRICPSAGGGIQAGGSSQSQHQRSHVWCHLHSGGHTSAEALHRWAISH